MKYGILPYPHPNRRYYDALKSLCLSEFRIVTYKLAGSEPGNTNIIKDIGYRKIGGIELLCFEIDRLDSKLKKALFYLSMNYILFELHDDKMLKPITEERSFYFSTDISGILKYKGKTNEMFTDMLINLGVFSSDFYKYFDTPLNILDPICGKGTTLYAGLIKGYNTAGIELNKKDVLEMNTFIKKYLEQSRYKHKVSNESITAVGKTIGKKTIYETSDTPVNFKNKDFRTMQLVNGNTVDSAQFFKKDSFHTIIADLPYGVQHAGKATAGTAGASRTGKGSGAGTGAAAAASGLLKPEELVKASVAGWMKLLAKGGTIVMAFNTYTLKRKTLEAILSEQGLKVFNVDPYDKLEHWVEQAISRDVLVAKKV